MRFTALGRPLDPSWPTNRAVMVLIPVGAAIGWAWNVWGAGMRSPWSGALVAAGAVLGGWALGREVDPDRQGTAFVAMVWAVAAGLTVPSSGLLPLFTVLLLARVVDRTVGPPATVLDAGVALGLVLGCVAASGNPGFGVVGAVAFAVDVALGGPRRHGLVAVLAVAGAAWGLADPGFGGGMDWALPSPRVGLLAAAIAGSFLVALVRTRSLVSVSDRGGLPLEPRRVRWGMAVVLLWALATVERGDVGIREGAMVWAVLAAVPMWRVVGGDVRGMSQEDDRPRNGE